MCGVCIGENDCCVCVSSSCDKTVNVIFSLILFAVLVCVCVSS